MRSAVIWDTSVLNVYLQVPGKETCGPADDPWDKTRIDELVQRKQAAATLFVLPVAAIIECGNHIAQARNCDRFQLAQQLAQLILQVAEGQIPWAAIADYEHVLNSDALKQLASEWPEKAAQKLSMADLTIQRVAEHFARSGYAVEILTGDRGLKALAPPVGASSERPRRRS